jgi:hypothetical protein
MHWRDDTAGAAGTRRRGTHDRDDRGDTPHLCCSAAGGQDALHALRCRRSGRMPQPASHHTPYPGTPYAGMPYQGAPRSRPASRSC